MGICLLGYLFFWVMIDNNAHTIFSCYASVKPPYVEETHFFVFLTIGLVWPFLMYKNREKGLWFKVTGYGSLAFVAFVLVTTVPQWIKREPFYDDFDSAGWQISEGIYSGKMARKLVHDKTMIGKHKDEVTEMLGETTWDLGYQLSYDQYLSLYLEYDNDTVKMARLYCRD